MKYYIAGHALVSFLALFGAKSKLFANFVNFSGVIFNSFCSGVFERI